KTERSTTNCQCAPYKRAYQDAAWGRQARGGGSAAGTVEDSVGQQATLTSCQPGSDTPGPPVGLWAGDRPPSAQVRTIIPPQVHRPGQSGNPPLRQVGSRLLVNPDIIHVVLGRRRRRTIGITGPTSTDIEVEHQEHLVGWNVRCETSRFDVIDIEGDPTWLPQHLEQVVATRPICACR